MTAEGHSHYEIPEYLQAYIVEQDATQYTAIDHASWRFILKLSQAFFAKHAHQMYLDGLRETGISTDRIPLISEMDERLSRFGWRAVAVSGFIPPAVFMEFLARGILPIACDMRKLENIAYTPAPDIVHEAAGHAPIIADPEYADYLHHYGELAEKAIFSSQDLAVYNAVKNLSDTKEDPRSTEEQIAAAQGQLDEAIAAVDHDSEATQLGRMGWWTIEYGLIGTPENPKIYGAGLLSSIGESYNCLGPSVKKVPLTVDCIHQSFDITKPQPQLFLAPDFQSLTRALDELANQMAFRQGGVEGLERARKAATTTTSVYDSGVQVSGTLAKYLADEKGAPCYLQYQGPTQLAYQNREIQGQGAGYHNLGFGSPVGRIKGLGKSPAALTVAELESLGFREGGIGRMEFESGVVVEGKLKNRHEVDGRNLLLIFEDCRVTLGADVLFQPDWGTYDMTCGEKIVSVFGHAADRKAYLDAIGGFKQEPGKQKTNLTEANRELNDLYGKVRKIRDDAKRTGVLSPATLDGMSTIHERLESAYPEEWLLRYELLELSTQYRANPALEKRVRDRLAEIAKTGQEKADMIKRGLELL